jgi:hypothetical protein
MGRLKQLFFCRMNKTQIFNIWIIKITYLKNIFSILETVKSLDLPSFITKDISIKINIFYNYYSLNNNVNLCNILHNFISLKSLSDFNSFDV